MAKDYSGDGQWITINGKHIFIEGATSVKDATEKYHKKVAEDNEKTKDEQIAKKKEEAKKYNETLKHDHPEDEKKKYQEAKKLTDAEKAKAIEDYEKYKPRKPKQSPKVEWQHSDKPTKVPDKFSKSDRASERPKNAMPTSDILKALKAHHVNIKEENGKILAGGVWKGDQEIYTDVTNYSKRKLYNFLGY